MLGCQDFCGYYDWTFHYIRRRWGNEAVSEVMGDAVGGESQAHYLQAAQADGLRGLLHRWDKTGVEEHCDWTFRHDAERNVLRWDMRQCPSKGFLLNNDLNADEDYCDHCMGWIVPLLDKAGVEVVAHEHNHCGQCWAEMRIRGKPMQSLADRPGNIQSDPRWQRGFVERWAGGVKQPLAPDLPLGGAATDPSDLLIAWFAHVDELTILGLEPDVLEPAVAAFPREHVIDTGLAYAAPRVFDGDPLAVMLDDRPDDAQLENIAQRFTATPAQRRPLLMCGYLPSGGAAPAAFGARGLPRPIQVLPLLIRRGVYVHQPRGLQPNAGDLALLLASALQKRVHAAGIGRPVS